MTPPAESSINHLIQAGTLLSDEIEFKSLISIIVEQSRDITRSDISSLFLYSQVLDEKPYLKLIYKQGIYCIKEKFLRNNELISFIEDCKETVLILERKKSPFLEILLHKEMQSGICLPINTGKTKIGIVILNSRIPFFYNNDKFSFLDAFIRLAGGMLHNSRMYRELKTHLRDSEKASVHQEPGKEKI